MTATGAALLARVLHAACVLMGVASGSTQAQAGGDGTWDPRRECPLTCRGGGELAFDTISPPSDTGGMVRLSLSFVARPTPAGHPAPVPAAALARSIPLPFDLRYFPLLVLGLVVLTWTPMLVFTGRRSGWRRLADVYPNRNTGRGRSFRASPVLMGMTNYRNGARLTPDESHLHFAMPAFLRPGHRPFSVPWSEIAVSRDEWPWFPLKGHSMVRLTLAKRRDLRILMPLRVGERLVSASGGRLDLGEPGTVAAAHQAHG